MVDVDGERRVADLVAALILERDGRGIGPAEPKNESPPGLRVDYVFDQPADPPAVALEITRLMDQPLTQGQAALHPLRDALQATADAERLGDWLVAVNAYANLSQLRPVVADLMREGLDIRVNSYTSADIIASSDRSDIPRKHRVWEALGLVSVERAPAGYGVQVAGLARGGEFQGFTHLLDEALASNAEKLAECRPRETHLAVEVWRHDCTTFRDRTPEPVLPESTDVLWVIFRWAMAHETQPLWRLRRGGAWDPICDPQEAV